MVPSTIWVSRRTPSAGTKRPGRLRRQRSRVGPSSAPCPSTLTDAGPPQADTFSEARERRLGQSPKVGEPSAHWLAQASCCFGPARLAPSRWLGKAAWAVHTELASATPTGSPSLPFHCWMSAPCAGDSASPSAWFCSRSIPPHSRRAALTRHRFAGLGKPPGPVSASWRALRPMAGPSVLLLRAGPTRTLSEAWQGRQGWPRRAGER